MEKTKGGEDTKKNKRIFWEYRVEKITGFNNENVQEKNNQYKHRHLKVTGVNLIMFILKQAL